MPVDDLCGHTQKLFIDHYEYPIWKPKLKHNYPPTKTIQSTVTPLQEKIDQRLNDAKIRILISMGMGSLALLGILFLMFR